MRRAYRITDTTILDKAADLGSGGSTAVTAILINGQMLVVANVGDSRAVICKNGVAKQLSVDHEPNVEREEIERRGGFVSNFPGKNSLILVVGSHNAHQNIEKWVPLDYKIQGMFRALMGNWQWQGHLVTRA